MSKSKTRGIFAIEGEWHSDLRRGLSFKPILELIQKLNKSPFVHRDAATRDELFYYLKKWTQRAYAKYPILYLGFHGNEEVLLIGDGRKKGFKVTLGDLEEVLSGRCSRRIIFIGGCQTVKTDARNLKRFLKNTGALAICGYKKEVDMLRSAAFELLLFDRLLSKTLTVQGVKAMYNAFRLSEKRLCNELGFRMVVRGAS